MSVPKTRLVAALQNVGMPLCRHSVGAMVVDHLGERLGLSWEHHRQSNSIIAEHVGAGGQPILFVKPKLAMNINGPAISALCQARTVTPTNVLIVHDELDLELGKTRIKKGGSAKGHNGVRSVHNAIRSQESPRLLVGIGRPSNDDIVAWVLGNFRSAEMEVLRGRMDEISDSLLAFLEKPPS
eukprot:m.243561 g.243561  ORF g.243561 m.243561 type:complete len:183 (+) comp28013_c0_seq1:20-568(+)